MRLLRVEARNFRTHQALDLTMPRGACAIVGPNGAGKSSILAAIDVGLFGARSLDPYVAEQAEDALCEVVLTIAHDASCYRIRRSRSTKAGGKTSLAFEQVNAAADWAPLTVGTIADTQALIERTLGVTRETVHSSSLLMQGNGAAWTDANPADRKRILGDALGLGLYETLLGRARSDRRGAEVSIAQLDALIAQADRELVDLPRVESELEETKRIASAAAIDLACAEQALADGEAEAEKRRAAAERWQLAIGVAQSLDAEADRAGGELRRLSHQIATAEETVSERSYYEEQAAQAAQLEAAIEQAHAAQLARAEAARNLDALKAASRLAESVLASAAKELADREAERDAITAAGEDATCPTCGQHVGKPPPNLLLAITRAKEEVALGTRTRDEHAIHVRGAESRLPAAPIVGPEERANLAQAREAQKHLARIDGITRNLAETKERHEQLAATVSKLTAERDHARNAAATIEQPALVNLDPLRGAVAGARHRIAEHERRAAVLAAEYARLGGLVIARDANQEQAQAAADRAGMLTILERAYGPDGIRLLIVENVVPTIEQEANRILAALDAPFSVELRTQRATQKGELRDALDIILRTAAGSRPYETFSGGEKTRIDLALRISLARLLANRRGADVRLLAIDEPDGLDASGMERLAALLRDLVEFDTILLVSHVAELRDALDQTLVVTRDADGWSSVSGQGSPPPARPVVGRAGGGEVSGTEGTARPEAPPPPLRPSGVEEASAEPSHLFDPEGVTAP